SRLERASEATPAAIRAAAAIAEWRAGRGRGGRPEGASPTGGRAAARPGHQAAAVAPNVARRTVAAITHQGRLSRSTRWSSADSSVGANTSHAATPWVPPTTAAIAPTMAPFASSTSRSCFSVAPTAASMPSCRSRRWATTAKPAGATRGGRGRKAGAGGGAGLREPSRGADGEAGGGDQRRQEQEDGGHGEHGQSGPFGMVVSPQ